MEPLIALMAILVVGSSIWVGIDAWSIGARKGLLPGIVDLGPVGWFFACLGIWVLAFPLYLANRGDIAKAVEAEAATSQPSGANHHPGSADSMPANRPADVQTPCRRPRRDSSDPAIPGQMYKVKLAAGEFGPFALERLQEFVGTGQLRPESVVLPELGGPIAATEVPGLEFPPAAPASAEDVTCSPEPDKARPSQARLPAPRSGSAVIPDTASTSNQSDQEETVATPPPPQVSGERPRMHPTEAAPTGPTAAPGAPPLPGGAFPPSPYRKADSGGTGAGMGVIGLLVLIAGLQLLGVVLRHTVSGPRGRWEHKVSSASDLTFASHFDELGKEGWQVVSCRRALAGSGTAREYRYECILKRSASSSSD